LSDAGAIAADRQSPSSTTALNDDIYVMSVATAGGVDDGVAGGPDKPLMSGSVEIQRRARSRISDNVHRNIHPVLRLELARQATQRRDRVRRGGRGEIDDGPARGRQRPPCGDPQNGWIRGSQWLQLL
jgi:hypothetical protein